MQKLNLLIISIFSIFLFTGCAPKAISVPKEKVNIDDYKKENINKNNNVDLIIYANRAGIKPVIVKIDNQIIQEMSPYTYSYHEIENGFHWIAVNGTENDSFLCKDFTEGKHIINVDNGIGIFDARFYLKEKQGIDDIDEESKQIIQKQKHVKTFTTKLDFNGILVQSNSKNEKISNLVEVLKKNLKEMKSIDINENHLILDVTLVDFKDGNSLGRWFWGGMDAAKDYADALSIKTDIIYNNQIIDTIYSSKIITGGIFGGFTSGMIKDIADEITSYTMCKFYQKQFLIKESISN